MKGIELLKNKLKAVDSLLLISHDRALMDEICNKIIEVEDGNISFFEGNFSAYRLQKDQETDRKRFEYEAYIDNKKHIEAAIINRASKVKAIKKTPSRMGNSEARLHKRESTEIQKKINQAASSLKTRLEKLETKEKPKELQQIKPDFSLTNPPQNKIVVSSDALSFGYTTETTSRQILSDAKFSVLNGVKYAVLGENGAGKTTLLNQIFQRNEAVRIAPKANLGYFCQEFEDLNRDKTILQNVMQNSVQTETTARTILARLLFFGDDVYKKVGVLSGGELIKVSFAKLFVSDSNVLLLDEPTNYLDMPSIQALEDILCQYDGTVLFVSHDEDLLSMWLIGFSFWRIKK
jgi:macrolide transport system ATP-binding/permease protein